MLTTERKISVPLRLPLLCAVLFLAFGCAQVALPPAKTPDPPAVEETEESSSTTFDLEIKSVQVLHSPLFAVLEITFRNLTNEWQEIKQAKLAREQTVRGPRFELVIGGRLRSWQISMRENQAISGEPRHPLLTTLAAEPEEDKPVCGDSKDNAGPPRYLLCGPFKIPPGLTTTKWVVLNTYKKNALIGHELFIEYTFGGDDNKVETKLFKLPEPSGP